MKPKSIYTMQYATVEALIKYGGHLQACGVPIILDLED